MIRVSHSAHSWALRFSILTLCFALVLAGIPLNANVKGRQNNDQDGRRTQGAPSPNLPNLDEVRAAGGRNEKQPDIKLPAPVAATRCRHHDKKCKETKEKVSLTPSYERLRGLLAHNDSQRLASLFNWKAPLEGVGLPAWDSLLFKSHNDARPDVPRLAQAPALNEVAGLRRAGKANRSLPRAAAHSFRSPVQGGGYFIPPVPASDYAATLRVDEINRTGGASEDLYSGNFHWSAPLLSLPGRAGHDLNLALCYNSLVWLKSQGSMIFDPDYSWPSAGFHLGFPTFQGPFLDAQTNLSSYLMFTPSGRVVELRRVTTSVYEARDGSLSRLTWNASGYPVLTTRDGTTYTYGQTLDIKDRNGNLSTISFAAGTLNYSTITDTLGRVITFNYGAYNDLQTITQTWEGVTKTLVTFSYDNNFQIFTNFPGLTLNNITNGAYEPVLYQVDLIDGTRYNFQYNTYGQVTRIELRGGSFLRSYVSYNLPANVAAGAQSDCPRFTQRTDWAYDWNAGTVNTNFCFSDSTCPWTATHTVGKVTTPDGTTQREVFATTGWQRGLTTQTETWAAGVRKKWTTLAWENTGVLYQLNPRISETNIYDDANGDGTPDNRRRTTIWYDDYTYNLPSEIDEYNADGTTILRATEIIYNYASAYINRRIIGLPIERTLYDGSNVLQAKVQYSYDEAGMLQAHSATPVRHDTTNYGIGFSTGRGNLTTVRRYDINNQAQYVENKTGYYITGNPAYTKDALNHQTTFNYDGNYLKDNGTTLANGNTFAYPTQITDPDNFYSTFFYHFERGGLRRAIDPKGASVLREYDGQGRMWKVINETNAAFTRYNFDPSHNYVQSWSTIQEGQGEFYSITTFDGHGRVRTTASDHPGSQGQYKAQYNAYDNMGRLWQQSNPTEINSVWSPYGDDSAGWAWSLQTYDWNGRPLVSTNTDSTTKTISYTGCGCAGGQVMTLTDESSHKQKVYSDVLGRNFKTETLQLVGSTWNVYSTQLVTFNVRDQVTQSSLIVGTNGTSQTVTNQYDGHGRLWKNKTPLQTTDTIYEYFNDDQLKKVTDARGAATNYIYNFRDLVTDITYDVPPNNPPPTDPLYVAPAQPVHFTYDLAGNRLTMTDGIGSVTYAYNTLSRLLSETRSITEINKSYSLTYGYNLAGQVTQVNFVSPSFPADNVTTDYQRDKAGQLIGITGAPFAGTAQYASQVKYRAFGALKTLAYGNSHNTNATYNSRLQLQSLDVKRSDNVAIANKTYAYYSDSRLKYSSDPLHSEFARAYQYDHAGRLTDSWTGIQATNFFNGVPVGSSTVPYQQTFTYDVWGNRLTNAGKIWSNTVNETETYNAQTLRHDGWQYDNAGNVLNDSLSQLKYDAAGRNISVIQTAAQATQAMDGDGLVMRQDPNSNVPHFFINSSVLGGKVIAEVIGVDGPPTFLKGERTDSYVYFGQTRLATQNIHPASGAQFVYWHFFDPLTGTKMQFYPSDPTVNRQEPDSQAIDVDLVDPATLPPPAPDPEEPTYAPTSGGYDPTKPTYYVDGIRVTERFALNLLQTGGATLDPKFAHDVSTLNRAGIIGHWERKLVYKPVAPGGTEPLTFSMGGVDLEHFFVVDSVNSTSSSNTEYVNLVAGEPIGANGPKKRHPDFLDKEKCRSLLQAIYDIANDIRDRIIEFRKDRYNMRIPGNTYHHPGSKNPGGLATHIEEYYRKKGALKSRLDEYNKGRCGNRGGPSAGPTLLWARTMMDIAPEIPDYKGWTTPEGDIEYPPPAPFLLYPDGYLVRPSVPVRIPVRPPVLVW